MTKAEIKRKYKERQIEICEHLIQFVKEEGFVETVDKVGSISLNTPIFYKKISENTFLVFTIPNHDRIEKYGFTTDFWKVMAKSEIEFLSSKIENHKLLDLRLSFDLEEDINLYRQEISKKIN